MSTSPIDAAAELDAMKVISEALSPLELESKARVIDWVISVHGMNIRRGPPGQPARKVPDVAERTSPDEDEQSELETEDLASLYNRARPETEVQKVLVASYWLQFIRHQADFTGQDVNSELKNLGHGVANVTVCFNRLKEQRPAMVMQVRKEGTTRQARKKYRVTTEGKKSVEAMLESEEE